MNAAAVFSRLHVTFFPGVAMIRAEKCRILWRIARRIARMAFTARTGMPPRRRESAHQKSKPTPFFLWRPALDDGGFKL
jgi:hypothetical protein